MERERNRGRVWRASTLLLILASFGGSVFGQILINEVDAYGTLEDALGRGEDWVELVNAGEEPVSLNGLWLSDDPEDWGKWALPDLELAPGGHFLVFASGRDVGSPHHWECPAKDTDDWRYFIPQGPLNQDWRTLGFDASNWEVGPGSLGYGDGDDAIEIEGNTLFMRRTFPVNDVEELAQGWLSVDYDDGYIAFLNGRELARSSNMEGVSVAYDQFSGSAQEAALYQGGTPEAVAFDPREWLVQGQNVLAVQVHNAGANSSDLTARPFLALGRSTEAQVPYGALPGWWNPEPHGFHANFKLKPGEPVVLSTADGELLDVASLPQELRSGIVLRRGSGSNWCFSNTATPGAPNSGSCYNFIAPAPNVQPASGWYNNPTVSASVGTFSGPPGQPTPTMTLRFTTDGSEPTPSSAVFTGFWNPDETTVLSIRAFAEGALPSATVDRSYFIGEPQSGLQTVSIITDPDHLWDWNTGIYVMGPNAGQDYPHMGANFWQPWSRESRLEWFDGDGEPVAEARFDLEIHGGWSRAEPQRSFRLDFKPRYTGPLEHAVFASKPGIEAFGNLNLRNGGQASWENKIQDAFYGELALETHAVASGWRPVEVYLNGDYWGAYGAREKSDEQFVEDNFGWDEDGVDMVNQWETLTGAPSAFEACMDPLLLLPSGSAAFHDAFEEQIDVASFIDYFIFQIHGQNVDWITAPWGTKNIKMFRAAEEDKRWRAILYDTDACFGAWGTSPWEDYLSLTLNPPYDSRFNDLFIKMVADAEFGCAFATRTCDLLETVFDPVRFDAGLDAAAQSIAPVMARHINRWNSPASLSYWHQRLDLMSNHNAQRIAPERDQVQQHFGFSDPEILTVDWSAPFAGEVQVNGMSGLETGWTGRYFGECPLRISAIPHPGQGFLGWQNNLHTALGLVDASQPMLELSLEDDDTFFAQFGPCLGGATISVVASEEGFLAQQEGSPIPLAYAWYLDGQWVGEGPSFTPGVPGDYLLLAAGGNCTIAAPIAPWPPTEGDADNGVSSVAPLPRPVQSGLSIVPNPARPADYIQVRGEGQGTLAVFNAAGIKVWEEAQTALPLALPCSDWPSGVYAVRFQVGDAVQKARLLLR